jgi:hypothetical protein
MVSAHLGLEGRDLAGQKPSTGLHVALDIVGMGDVLEALADQLGGGVAGDVAQRVIDQHPAAVLIQ